ncbi:hypothetical protein [Providencia sp. PROV129]|uniref:hypothetical protein n=1 Tax=Providencia sp. PROV129 TaxID=2949839 RepID=UPI002348EF92|nr:hypothetical protein [Providencia sp. PROV129]
MTNIQLLLLATNNLTNNTELSHSQESYVYQYYYTHMANQFKSIADFMSDFVYKTTDAISDNSLVSIPREKIYQTIEEYLLIVEKRYIERQRLLKNSIEKK